MITTFLVSLLAAAPLVCSASSFSFAGSFGADNQEQFFSLIAASGSTLGAETWSYASGGFAPEISLFDSTGQLIALDANGGSAPNCGPRHIDPSTHFCFDASLSALQLNTGAYTLVLTEQGNNPVGALADGFSADAKNGNDPAFTGTNAGLPGAMFLDPGNSAQRTNQWVLSIDGAGVVVTPEPSSGFLLSGGFILMAVGFFGRRIRTQPTTRSYLALLPLLALTQTAYAASGIISADTYISQTAAANNYGSLPSLSVSNSNSALIQFNLAALPTGIISADISKATLILYANRVSASGTVDLATVSTNWSEGNVTAQNAPALIPIPGVTAAVRAVNSSYLTSRLQYGTGSVRR